MVLFAAGTACKRIYRWMGASVARNNSLVAERCNLSSIMVCPAMQNVSGGFAVEVQTPGSCVQALGTCYHKFRLNQSCFITAKWIQGSGLQHGVSSVPSALPVESN